MHVPCPQCQEAQYTICSKSVNFEAPLYRKDTKKGKAYTSAPGRRGGARQQVELIEIAVDQALGGQSCEQVHQLRVHLARLAQLAHLARHTRQ